MNRRELLARTAALAVTGTVTVVSAAGMREKPTKLEPGQVYRTADGRPRIIGDHDHDGRWAVCGPIQAPEGREDFWICGLAWPIEIQTWTYIGHISEL